MFSALFFTCRPPAIESCGGTAAVPCETKRFYTKTLIPYAKRFTRTWEILYKSVTFVLRYWRFKINLMGTI
jgi:hypothetical protein